MAVQSCLSAADGFQDGQDFENSEARFFISSAWFDRQHALGSFRGGSCEVRVAARHYQSV